MTVVRLIRRPRLSYRRRSFARLLGVGAGVVIEEEQSIGAAFDGVPNAGVVPTRPTEVGAGRVHLDLRNLSANRIADRGAVVRDQDAFGRPRLRQKRVQTSAGLVAVDVMKNDDPNADRDTDPSANDDEASRPNAGDARRTTVAPRIPADS